MRIPVTAVILVLSLLAFRGANAAAPQTKETPPTAPAANPDIKSIPLPGASEGGLALDYLAADRERHRVWVPAAGTGKTVVIDTKTQAVKTVENFPTKEVERQGRKRIVGPSSATIGDGYVYVGNRADSAVCAINATSLERAGCVTLPSSPDGVAYIGKKKEVWVTTPRDQSLTILDVADPKNPKIAGTIKLEGAPEGYAVDDGRGLFYTNLEDKDRTLRIDVASRSVSATWMPECGEDGPRGLAIEPKEQFLMVVCEGHVEVLDAGKDGKILSKLDTGEGVDNIDYLPARRSLYAAAGGAGTLTVARLDGTGGLKSAGSVKTVARARNAVVADDGTVYVADGPDGKILVVTPAIGSD